ncbi:MAG: glycosyl transferase family 2, partial [Verrucomicrobia bacterium]|nr:glycosyl transferase family 2 [Verrucomicrobiota bacterium]
IAMGGWDQEIFWSKLQVSLQLWELRAPSSVVIASLEDAHQFRPHRVEPIYYLAVFYNQQEQYEKAYRCIKDWLALPKPEQKDCLFNEDWQHDYGLPFELSICAYYVGQYQESLDICNVLLNDSTLPDDVRALAERNRQFPLAKLQSENKERMVSTSIHPK